MSAFLCGHLDTQDAAERGTLSEPRKCGVNLEMHSTQQVSQGQAMANVVNSQQIEPPS